jgi:leucyl aminopeptidase
MSVPKCSVETECQAKAGDLWLLPYTRKDSALFAREGLPAEIAASVAAPTERGGARTVFAGAAGGRHVVARTVRLDAEHVPAASQMRRAISSAFELGKKEERKRIVVALDAAGVDLVTAAHEGAVVGGYVFDRYLTKKQPRPPVVLVVASASRREIQAQRREREIVYECLNLARDLINEPPNVLNPPELAERMRTQGRKWGLAMEVWDEKRLARERCGGVLAVGQGAKAKPRFVIGRYAPRGARKHLCLVGKGITFDTGGYGLKPADSQLGMKYDMSGAAIMFAAACALARLHAPLRVTVLAPLAENDISGESYLTTSVLTTRSGRTVEVEHTDAEGRLILADALTIAGEAKPDWIVDAATLTGSAVVALGEDMAAAFGTDTGFTESLIEAGRGEDELFWRLPLHMPYGELLKATIADCKNVGPRWGGSITAALFLKSWVPEGVKWVHCDIAGPAGKEETLGHLGKGGKGFGMKTMVALGRRLAAR